VPPRIEHVWTGVPGEPQDKSIFFLKGGRTLKVGKESPRMALAYGVGGGFNLDKGIREKKRIVSPGGGGGGGDLGEDCARSFLLA